MEIKLPSPSLCTDRIAFSLFLLALTSFPLHLLVVNLCRQFLLLTIRLIALNKQLIFSKSHRSFCFVLPVFLILMQPLRPHSFCTTFFKLLIFPASLSFVLLRHWLVFCCDNGNSNRDTVSMYVFRTSVQIFVDKYWK